MSIVNFLKKNKLTVLVFLIYLVLLISIPTKGVGAVKNSTYYIVEMIEIMPVILILTGLIGVWVPKEVIIKGLGNKSGIRGALLSLLLGSVSAGPIYAAFPMCKVLLRKGAKISNIVIILSAWAVIKVPMLATEAKFLGFNFMVIRWMLTTISIFVMASIVSKIVKVEDLPEEELSSDTVSPVVINQDSCIGCGVCARHMDGEIKMKDKKAIIVVSDEEVDEKIEKFKEVAKKCPVKAINVQ